MTTIVRATTADQVESAVHLLDHATKATAVVRFLDDPGHHLLLAVDGAGRTVGFVSGVELTHPDKGTEMFLNELEVEEPVRRKGIGRQLVAALAGLAEERGCYGMWVGTDESNVAAAATYRSAGAGVPEPAVILVWEFDRDESTEEPGR